MVSRPATLAACASANVLVGAIHQLGGRWLDQNGRQPCGTCVRYEYDCYYGAGSDRGLGYASRLSHGQNASIHTEGSDLMHAAPVPGPSPPDTPTEHTKFSAIFDPYKTRYMSDNSAVAFPRLLGIELSSSNAPRLHSFAWNLGVSGWAPGRSARFYNVPYVHRIRTPCRSLFQGGSSCLWFHWSRVLHRTMEIAVSAAPWETRHGRCDLWGCSSRWESSHLHVSCPQGRRSSPSSFARRVVLASTQWYSSVNWVNNLEPLGLASLIWAVHSFKSYLLLSDSLSRLHVIFCVQAPFSPLEANNQATLTKPTSSTWQSFTSKALVLSQVRIRTKSLRRC